VFAGPAGIGKTEMIKDLANSLAKCCYVFNCSPEMDYKSLGNIFKGLASSGSWGCFDEFNRLIPEVLSVCSVQFKAVCDGVKADNERITIEGDEISLDPTVGVFITMNPGYLGRSELPEGLKALFRPITVMVPDLVLICENMLMAEGFVGAKELASKFYGLYSLLKELLSKAPHYDWGLRAVKSVLVVAGGFKRAEPDIPEDVLLMRALRDFNTPKIVKEDEVVFFGLLGDLFPGLDPPRKLDDDLESLVHQTCINQKLWPDETFRLKIVQLKELLEIRHCVFVMGPPGAGKTSCWKTLCGAQGLRGEKTKFLDINPKSITTHELYGSISLATREWRDGLLSKIMRDLGLIPDEKPKWIVLDGDLDANWIESMNSVMDDNRMLTLASNE
jgi:dynein heavy chain